MKGKFDVTPTELVSQKHFFNMKNQENEYKHISPWHFPFVQNLLQQKPVINFDMNGIQMQEDAPNQFPMLKMARNIVKWPFQAR